MDVIERLTALFERFPGIGPRQAERFVQFLLRSSLSTRRELAEAIRALGEHVEQCDQCMRFYAPNRKSGKVCSICSNPKRDTEFLAVVATDADLAALEKSGSYHGHYFVLGGTVSLASEHTNGLRIRELIESLPARIKKGLREIVLAFPAHPEGDATGDTVREHIKEKEVDLLVTVLGRGLSTGSELEYADAETIKNALENRR